MDLALIARKLPDVEYNPERFPGVVMRVEEPRGTFLIFSTGKMVLTGLRKASHAEGAVEKALYQIRTAGVKVSNPQIKIVNMVASGKLGVKIDLNMAAIMLESAMYEPEIFPGLIYRLQDPKAVFLIYSNGSIVCTGVKDEETVKKAVTKLKQQVNELNLVQKDIFSEGNHEMSLF